MREMKWIELIRVRSSVKTLQEAMPSLEEQVQEIENALPDAETFFMRHAIYDGDLSVAIVWRNDAEPQQSVEGLMIAERLQNLGSIDHAVWIPVNNGFKQNRRR